MKIIDELYPKVKCETRLSDEGTLWIKTDTKSMEQTKRVIIENTENKFCKVFYQDAGNIVRCKDCKFKRLYDEGETKYYYCALEDRPNRNWSVDDTDYCSWGERREDGE